ncbi:MAG: TolC family protein, partial [Candidatus Aminicenantales bacterium]
IPDPKLKAFMAKEIDGQNKGFGLTMEIPLWNFKSKEIAAAENLFLKEKKELKAVKIELTTEVKNKFKKLKLSDQKIGLFQSGLPTQAE